MVASCDSYVDDDYVQNGGATWGCIVGTLSDQTDLSSALNGETGIGPQLRDFSETMSAVTPSDGILTLDIEQSNVFDIFLTENVTSIVIVNPPPIGQLGTITLRFEQDATGGHTVDFAGLDFGDAGAPGVPSSGRLWVTALTRDAGALWEAMTGFVASVAVSVSGEAWADGTFWLDGTGWI